MFSSRLPRAGTEGPMLALFASQRDGLSGVIDLTVSNPTRVGLDYPEQALREALAPHGVGRYAPDAKGLPAARACLASDWQGRGHRVADDDIVLTASTSEAYGILFKLFCDPGSEVLVPEPSYPLFDVLTRLEGLKPKAYRLSYDGAWHIDFESLTRARSPHTRAVVVVSPNNPTGNFVSPDEIQALSALGLPIISDEVFWRYRFKDSVAPSVLGAPDSLICVLDGLSKRCGMPQVKLGWITLSGPEALKAEARTRLELINDSYLSTSTQVQLALPALLELGKGVGHQLYQRCTVNLTTLRTAVRDSALSLLYVEGGWSACLRLPDVATDDDWALSLFQQRKVLVQPGWFYDLGPAPHLVLSLLVPPEQFARGVRELVAHTHRKLDAGASTPEGQ